MGCLQSSMLQNVEKQCLSIARVATYGWNDISSPIINSSIQGWANRNTYISFFCRTAQKTWTKVQLYYFCQAETPK